MNPIGLRGFLSRDVACNVPTVCNIFVEQCKKCIKIHIRIASDTHVCKLHG